MAPAERLLSKLKNAKKTKSGWSACCPAHEDRKASLSVSEGDDDRALVKCHAGCSAEAVCAAVGLTTRDLMPERSDPTVTFNGARRTARPKPKGQVFATANAAVQHLEGRHGARSGLWTYTDAAGAPVGLTVRWDSENGKDIRPVSRHADGWRIEAMPDPRPLYRLPGLAGASRVLVVEGEPCADAARALGFTVTTSAGGAQAAGKADWSPLAAKEVWILPDNDSPGRVYAAAVADRLSKLAPAARVKVVELPGLPDAGDIVDWIDSHGPAAEPAAMRAELDALAAAAEWEPGGPAPTAPRFRPFPVDVLPQPVRRFVAAGAASIGCDPSYLALPLLVALASVIGNARRLELKRGWSAPALLWGAIVGESGTAKTPAFALVMRPIRARQRKALERYAEAEKEYEAELARWDKEMAAWKRDKHTDDEPPAKPKPPAAERFVVSDTTVEALAPILQANPRGLLLARDELNGWLGSFDRYAGKGGADSANWLSMFNAEAITVDRKTGVPKIIHVPDAAVCITGGIQPGILRRALSAEHRESGLAARLLLSHPPRKAKRWTEADISPKVEAELARLVERLYELRPAEGADGEPRPVLVKLSPEAKKVWCAYYDAHADEQADLSGDLSAAWSKLEEYAARLALVVHFIRWAANDPTAGDAGSVDAEGMGAGVTLAKWFKGEARRVYAMLDESDPDRETRQLVEWVERKGRPVKAREVQQGCRWLKEPGAAESALSGLVKAGRGAWLDVPPTAKGGRPTRAFALSTPSTVYETPATDMAEEGFGDVDSVGDISARAGTESTDEHHDRGSTDEADGDGLFANPKIQLPD